MRPERATLAFEALSIEGGLLSADWLARVAQLTAGGQAEADYRIPKGLNLRDEIGRYWRIAQAQWQDFEAGRRAGADAAALSERFVQGLLRDSFGFNSLADAEPTTILGRNYPVRLIAIGGRVPVVVAPAGTGLDTLAATYGDGVRRRTAFGLAQEYLNAADGAQWGLVSDGCTLRIVRDNASLTRPAWIEADIARMFTEELYADFAALWLLAHETRFGRPDQPVDDCALETWRRGGREEGTRAREDLRRGVEEALLALGQGFLAHPDNQQLRAALQSGTLSTKDFFNQLLRLVYRVIFLLTVEERGLLHAETANERAKGLYAEGYSLKHLRERSIRRSAHDQFSDLWEATKIVFRGTEGGEPRLGLPALGGLFSAEQCAQLDACRLENRALLLAMFRLCWLRDESGLVRVNWRDMGPEELGSVYEGLLELLPNVSEGARRFEFAVAGEAKGATRKLSGSYYTPDNLVQLVLDRALEPVVDAAIAAHPDAPAEAVLSLAILDPACGSGHFLLAAARRLAVHVARINTNGTPSAAEYRLALRQVVARCIFGVDRNPMALELARMALWLEAMTTNGPLTFVDHHLVCGDALIGLVDFSILHDGIASEAYEPVDGDDNEVVKRLAKKNRDALKLIEKDRKSGQRGLSFHDPGVVRQMQELEALPDDTLEGVAAKRAALQRALVEVEDAKAHPVGLAGDMLVAAFLSAKTPATEALVPTTADVRGVLSGLPPSHALVAAARATARNVRAVHWRLSFAQVFARGGFDVVLGNPPWDALSPDAKEFFSQWDVDVRFQPLAEQEATIEELRADPAIGRAWEEHCRGLYNSVAFMKSSGRYKLFAPGNLGKGDFNAYRMFVETALAIVRPGGRASQVVPEGLYNGANCMKIREELFERCSLQSMFGFENHRHAWFDGVDTRAQFAIYVAQIPGNTERFQVAFNIRSQAELTVAMNSQGAIDFPVSLVREFSPDALALMELGSQRDIDIAAKMYSAHSKFGDDSAGPPHRQYMAEIHMGNDRYLFTENPSGVPLYEGRMVGAYDHRAKGYRSGRGRKADWVDLAFSDSSKAIQPQWFVETDKVPEKVRTRYHQYRIGFCNVSSPTNERSLTATLIPMGVLAGHAVPTISFEGASAWHYMVWLAVANSFVMDFLVRKKVALNLTFTILDSMPFPRLESDDVRIGFIAPRVARLVCSGEEMISFWNLLSTEGWVVPHTNLATVPGELDPRGRAVLEAELNAYVAKELFGLTRDELGHVLDAFPIVEKRDRKAYGDYRTKRVILEVYDAMVDATRLGEPYKTNPDLWPASGFLARPTTGGDHS
jgi:hypothetical protein